jgi:hypothetical protein
VDENLLPLDTTSLLLTEGGIAESYMDRSGYLDCDTIRAANHNLRSSSRLVDTRAMHAYKLSMNRALKMHKPAVKEAIGREL